jgi:hypothetical protein
MSAIRRILEDLDVDGMLRLHAEVFPHLPPPASREQTLAGMHHARTQCEAISATKRFYSHRWLTDSGYPSALPDKLKPMAERIYPRASAAVGIALKTNSEIVRPILGEVRGAMEYAVLEAEGDGRLEDSPHVKRRMAEAKAKAIRKLVGV